jgi:hypothetical protein
VSHHSLSAATTIQAQGVSADQSRSVGPAAGAKAQRRTLNRQVLPQEVLYLHLLHVELGRDAFVGKRTFIEAEVICGV